MKNNRTENYDSVFELALDMYENYDENEDIVCCIAYYDVIQELVSDLIRISGGSFELTLLDLAELSEEEYLLSIAFGELSVEPMRTENGYMDYYADLLYVDGDVSTRILRNNENPCAEIVDFEIWHDNRTDELEDEFHCDGDCVNCDHYVTEDFEDEDDFEEEESNGIEEYHDESVHGFTVTRGNEFSTETYSFYSSDMDMVNDTLDYVKKNFM